MYYLKSKVETVFYKKHIEGGHVTKGDIQTSPMRVRSGSVVSTKRESEAEDKGNVLQGPGCNKVRRDEWIWSGDTGNGIVRLR